MLTYLQISQASRTREAKQVYRPPTNLSTAAANPDARLQPASPETINLIAQLLATLMGPATMSGTKKITLDVAGSAFCYQMERS